MVPLWVTFVMQPEVLLDSFGGQAVNSKALDTLPQSGYSVGSFRNFLHVHRAAWLLHALVSILSSGRAAGGE